MGYYNPNIQMLAPIGENSLKSGEDKNGVHYTFWEKCPGSVGSAEQGISCTYKAIHDDDYFKKLP